MHELMTVIVIWLAINFGLPESHEHPQVQSIPAQEMAGARYRMFLATGRSGIDPAAASAEIIAFYDHTREIIFIPDSWDIRSPADQSVLVHEMVHHLQSKAGLRYPCAQAREELAFAAQEGWLGQFGLNLESEFALNGMTILMGPDVRFDGAVREAEARP